MSEFLDKEDIKEYLAQLVIETAKNLHSDEDLWDSHRCARYLCIQGGAKSFLQHTAPLPSFPPAIELESTRNQKRPSLRWEPDDVKSWAKKRKRKTITD